MSEEGKWARTHGNVTVLFELTKILGACYELCCYTEYGRG